MRPATSSALLGLAVLLAGRGTQAQTDLVEVCETHPTWHSDRCLDANGEVLPDINDYLTCERTTTGHAMSAAKACTRSTVPNFAHSSQITSSSLLHAAGGGGEASVWLQRTRKGCRVCGRARTQ